MSNRRNIQFMYSPHNKATVLDCSFVVDPANGNGLGIRSLKPSGRIASVYMHTSATPAAGNPNPASGLIVVNLQDNYNKYLGGYAGAVCALSGSSITSGLTVGNAYVIVSVGASTLAQWQAAGLKVGIAPAVGVSFIAKATSVAGGGAVQAIATNGSAIDHIDVIGDANLMNSSSAQIVGSGQGMQIILGCFASGALAAPATGSVIGLNFYLNDSAQGV